MQLPVSPRVARVARAHNGPCEALAFFVAAATAAVAAIAPHPIRGARRLTTAIAVAIAVVASIVAPGAAHAGGGPENAVVIVDPADPVSLYLGHLYQRARGIPASNVVHMPATAADFAAFAAFQRPALEGELAARGIADHVDFVVVTPGGPFFMPMPGLVSTPCIAVNRISTSSAYTFMPIADEILGGRMFDQTPNRYYRGVFDGADHELAFDSQTAWFAGAPSSVPGARRYRIGFMLGYTGERGNTVEEIARLIDRSARADHSRPDGTFYFMTTADAVRSYRRDRFPGTVAAIQAMGGQAEALDGTLPLGRRDALGILTGITDPAVVGADVDLLPGAFADHLTSYAATFDSSSQGKLSQWVAAGASGSLGTVEEPCTGGKFPDPELHARYFAGMALGEALFRSVAWTAFQSLFYGDPLTQPFAVPPGVEVTDLPTVASGRLRTVPRVTPGRPGGAVHDVAVLVDGVRVASGAPGWVFDIDTRALDDGHHDLSVVARDAHPIRTQGRWRGALVVSNHGRWVDVAVQPPAGDRDTLFTVAARSMGYNPDATTQLELVQNGRVLAAAAGPALTVQVAGDVLGAGKAAIQVVARYRDRRSAVSAPRAVEVAFAGGAARPAGPAAPEAFGYAADLPGEHPVLIDLPAADPDGDPVSVEVVDGPAVATLTRQGSAWLIAPPAAAASAPVDDRVTFVAVDAGGARSAPATVALRFCPATARIDADGIRFCRAAALWLPWAGAAR